MDTEEIKDICMPSRDAIRISTYRAEEWRTLYQYILSPCLCNNCMTHYKRAEACITIRHWLRKFFKPNKCISGRLKSISDKKTDYRINDWMNPVRSKLNDLEFAIQFWNLET